MIAAVTELLFFQMLGPVWPDWAHLECFWWQIFLQKYPNDEFLGYFENITFEIKTTVAPFWEIWANFISTCGHTSCVENLGSEILRYKTYNWRQTLI